MKTYANHSNYVPSDGYAHTTPSLTVPGQVLELRQIRERYTRGQSVVSYPGAYDSPLPPGYENLSKIEKLEFARANKDSIENIRSGIIARDAAKVAEAEEERIKKEIEKGIAEKNSLESPKTT